jgi:peptide/nickel transport system substrate-binding protein
MPEAQKLIELFEAWRGAGSTEQRREIWHEILEVYSDQVYSVALIGGVLQPVSVRDTLRNVPEEAVYNWEPGAQFGVYRPDTFWFEQ